jgi:hypothetical protein
VFDLPRQKTEGGFLAEPFYGLVEVAFVSPFEPFGSRSLCKLSQSTRVARAMSPEKRIGGMPNNRLGFRLYYAVLLASV